MKRVGLFFGSFNPLTNAHVALAKGAIDAEAIDGAWFVLSPANPAKYKKNILADEEHRRNMMRAFIASEIDARLELCDIEYDMPRPSYTHNTLCALKLKYPHLDFSILCGSDTLSKILSWRTGPTILKENRFICQARGTGKYEWSQEVRDKTLFLDLEIPDISSTQVRGNISTGIAYNDLVPAPIAAYIDQHNLYRS
jgi:nicotinate-nucleotide adenylyltransferase